MAFLLSLPDKILTQVTLNLELKDLIALGDSHPRLGSLVFKNPDIWTSDLLFPAQDTQINDKFIKLVVPRITRHYGILSLKMIDLVALTWTGYMIIFDQFAHSVKHIEIQTTYTALSQLAHHLTVFAGNLALLQYNNKIPITFRQYAFDHEAYASALADASYLGQNTLHSLNDQFAQMKLDDPPFERLQQFHVLGNDGACEPIIRQLNTVAAFLSGVTHRQQHQLPSPIPTTIRYNNSNKRSREQQQSSSSTSHYYKHRRHDNNNNNNVDQQQDNRYKSSPQPTISSSFI
jgi:multidrug transporter EmrE-like cation transporter